MGRRKNSTADKLPQFVPLLLGTMDCPAWLALTPYAKALYPFVKRRVGYAGANNGNVSCSVREAAAYLGVSKDAAARALQDLQRKGFLVAVRIGRLGVSGEGKATTWRLPEIGTPTVPRPTRDYLNWSPDNEFAIAEVARRAA